LRDQFAARFRSRFFDPAFARHEATIDEVLVIAWNAYEKLELEEFFVNYHRLSDQKFRILALKGPDAARRCIRQARKRAH
jgi:hypothetical protein